MNVHIGDFWKSKQDKNVIYHVDDYAFKINEHNMTDLMIICSKLCIAIDQTTGLAMLKPENFSWYASVNDFKNYCELLLSAKRITKDVQKFKSDQDIIDYLQEKVGKYNEG